jgi:hypothetical protein
MKSVEIRPTFSLLHPTARPHGWHKAFDTWRERCDRPRDVEYILCVDKDRDKEQWHLMGEWWQGLYQAWGKFDFVVNEGRRCAVDAWNTAAKESTGHILITVADDYFPPAHWDSEILDLLDGKLDDEFVLDVDNQDGSDWLLPFSFVSRAYYERLGCLFWPEYFGLGADNDFTERARADAVIIEARDIKFSHTQLPAADPIYAWQHRPEAMAAYQRVMWHRREEGFPYGFDALARLAAGQEVVTL